MDITLEDKLQSLDDDILVLMFDNHQCEADFEEDCLLCAELKRRNLIHREDKIL